MEVKCPKCRFKYDTAVAPGITELACVCPRCGTPFSYVVTEEMKHPQPENPAATEQEPKEVEVVTTTENGKPAQPTTGQTSPVTEGSNEGWKDCGEYHAVPNGFGGDGIVCNGQSVAGGWCGEWTRHDGGVCSDKADGALWTRI